MIKIIESKQLEYLSLSLVLSFFILHNIIIVLIGISIAFYIIYIDHFLIHFNLKNNNTINKEKNIKVFNILENKTELSNDKESNISLVEAIEEFGIIPSINKNENIIE